MTLGAILRFGTAIGLMLALSACAALTGSASYRYETVTEDGRACKLTIDSRRDVAGPASVRIGKGCTVTVAAGSLSGGQVDAAQVSAIVAGTVAAVLGKPIVAPVAEPQE